MRDRKLDRLFDRFRKKGDTAALAKVFDATAAELLGVAVHLVRDPGEGEDLVQQTFLTAIEKADRYDADRRLIPWLVGILVRHAHAARRRRTRDSDDSPPDLPVDVDPSGQAEEIELTNSVSSALEGLPEHYRAVLEPYLFHGERAVDIAHSSGKSPGTVRVQIRRGLDELRRALPAGLTLGTGVLVGGRSLGDVRARVLEQAAKSARLSAPLGATTASSTTLLGALAMTNKFAIAGIALTLLTFFSWIGLREEAPERSALTDTTATLEPAARARESERLPALPAAANNATEVKQPERVEVVQPAKTSKAFELALSGATGRVVDEFGQAVVGVKVQLLEVRSSMFESMLSDPFDPALQRQLRALKWNPIVASDTTDDQGRFDLWGAEPRSGHGIGIDLGGARPVVRIIDDEMRSGERTDLGTIQLEAVRRLVGTVVDSQGQPVAGARVRAGRFPEEALGLAELRAGSWFMAADNNGPGHAVRVPPAIAPWIENLPIPTAQTNAEGRFELQGVPQDDVQVIVDDARFGRAVAEAGEQVTELESIAFAPRASYSGRVVDETGHAMAGAEVIFGSFHPLGNSGEGYGFAHERITSGPSGEFSFECAGQPLVCARASEAQPWSIESEFGDGTFIAVQSTLQARLLVKDREGRPVTHAKVHVARDWSLRKLDDMVNSNTGQGVVRSIAEGEYSMSELVADKYRVRVLAEGFALRETSIELSEDGQSFELELDRSGSREVRVLDAATKAPIESAKVSVLRVDDSRGVQSQGVTDGRGLVQLAGIPIEGEHELVLHAAHPAFASSQQKIDVKQKGTTEVLLSNTNQALFKLTVAGSTPLERLMVEINPRHSSGDEIVLPLLALSDAQGLALFEHLRSGEWTYSVTPRFLDVNVLELLSAPPELPTLASGKFTVREGQRAIIDVELSPQFFETSQPATSSGIEGTVHVRGAEWLQLHIGLIKSDDMELYRDWQGLADSGAYRLENIDPGDYHVLVLHMNPEASETFVVSSTQISVPRERMIRYDVELSAKTFEMLVTSGDGQPFENAELHIYSMDDESGAQAVARETRPGVHEVTAWKFGEYMAQATSPVEGLAASRIQFESGGSDHFEMRLSRGVLCSGTVHLPADHDNGNWWLNAYKLDGSGVSARVVLEVTDSVASFDIVGLSPGTYGGHVYFEDGTSFETGFELPEGGDGALELRATDSSELAVPIGVPVGADD